MAILSGIKKKAKYITNIDDLAVAGKIGLAGSTACLANTILNKGADALQQYSPGYVIKKAVTQTEKGVYNLDQTIEKEIEKIPGGNTVLDTNKNVVSVFWDMIPGLRGNPEAPRTQKFYERTQIEVPKHYAIEKKTVTETKIPPKYNTDAANQKSLLGSAGFAINALLAVYAVKEGIKHFAKKYGRDKHD